MDEPENGGAPARDFIREIVAADVEAGKHGGKVVTRFPPEPNGILHIGHGRSICLNFGVASEVNGGVCHLRFDDTNPTTEETEFVEAIQEDIRWLGFDWKEHLYFASNYFDRLHDCAVRLIERGKAYVDSLSQDEIRAHRGTLTEPGKESPYRDRSIEENLDLFARMKAGEFEDGAHVLRARIDMASPNITLRDPVLYRIRRIAHHRTGDRWCIYPMYDFTHCLSDAFEGITHSLCTLEFENNRALYEWVLDAVGTESRPRQIEFARLNLTYTILSKRHLGRLVSEGHVDGWDDPRMPTLRGMRRRGYTPESIRRFCAEVGLARREGRNEFAKLESVLREDLNARCSRVMAVLRPLRVVIENYPEDQVEEFEFSEHPEYPERGVRKVPFSRVLYIDRDDFRLDPPRKFFRLAPDREVRLRYAYFIRCVEAVTDEEGEVVELRCTYDPETRGGDAPDGRKVKGTLHWVSAEHSIPAEVRLYDHLFLRPDPGVGEGNFVDDLNPESFVRLTDCRVEPSLAGLEPESRVQFERQGYFCTDRCDSRPDALVFNRTATLRDTWAKVQKQMKAKG